MKGTRVINFWNGGGEQAGYAPDSKAEDIDVSTTGWLTTHVAKD